MELRYHYLFFLLAIFGYLPGLLGIQGVTAAPIARSPDSKSVQAGWPPFRFPPWSQKSRTCHPRIGERCRLRCWGCYREK
ncbi:hypothetical protein IWZ01DRAFT_113095 [Phyllosticta capitalensis]